jgi:hypothetical protein
LQVDILPASVVILPRAHVVVTVDVHLILRH